MMPAERELAVRIFAYWKAIESFLSPELPQPDGHEIWDADNSSKLPWNEYKNGYFLNDPESTWHFVCYIAPFDMESVNQELGEFLQVENLANAIVWGKAALAVVKLSAEGQLMGDPLINPLLCLMSDLQKRRTTFTSSAEIKTKVSATIKEFFASEADSSGESGKKRLEIQDFEKLSRLIITKCGGWAPRGGFIAPLRLVARRIDKSSGAYENPERDDVAGWCYRELERLDEAIRKKNHGPGLLNYLLGKDEDKVPLKTSADMLKYIKPEALALAAWPSSESSHLMLAEQWAVNAAKDRLAEGAGLFTISTPVGTGAVNVVKDLIASVLVDKAKALSQLEAPHEGFIKSEDEESPVHKISPNLKGFSFFVAARFDGDVEDFAKQFRIGSAEGPLTALTKNNTEKLAAGTFNRPEPLDWQSAKQAFIEALNNCESYRARVNRYYELGEACHELKERLIAVRKELSGVYAAELKYKAESEVKRSELQALRERWSLWGQYVRHATTIENFALQIESLSDVIANLEIGCVTADTRAAELDVKLVQLKVKITAEERRLSKISGGRSLRVASLTKLVGSLGSPRTYLEWKKEYKEVTKSLLAYSKERSALKQQRAQMASALEANRQQILARNKDFKQAVENLNNSWSLIEVETPEAELTAILKDLRAGDITYAARKLKDRAVQLERAVNSATADLAELESRALETQKRKEELEYELKELGGALRQNEELMKGLNLQGLVTTDYAWRMLDEADKQRSSPWTSDQFNSLRTMCFVKAYELCAAFVSGTWPLVKQNLDVLGAFITGRNRNRTDEELSDLWDIASYIAPVSCMSLPLAEQVLGSSGAEGIAWSVIMDAGRVSCQEVTGLIWRSSRSLLLGDPIGSKPQHKINFEVVRILRERFQLTELKELSSSAQSLADRSNNLGTTVSFEGQPRWVGAPLRVARSNAGTSFEAANEGPYNGLVINEPNTVAELEQKIPANIQ